MITYWYNLKTIDKLLLFILNEENNEVVISRKKALSSYCNILLVKGLFPNCNDQIYGDNFKI